MSQTTKKCLSYIFSLVGALFAGLLISLESLWFIPALLLTIASEFWHLYVIL